jgi:hypothetical protein
MNARLELEAAVVGDGSVSLAWHSPGEVTSYHLLIIRSGALRAYTSLQLTRSTERYLINGLSRHQRYLLAVLAGRASGGPLCSHWISVTPRAGLEPRLEESCSGVETHLARVERLWVMPQDARLTVYWQRTRGFLDGWVLDLAQRGRLMRRLELEPEVSSISLEASRGLKLQNGETYSVRLQSRFASVLLPGPDEVLCTPAAQGQERQANLGRPQSSLIYPFLDLSPEVSVFADEESVGANAGPAAAPRCVHCKGAVQWQSYRLTCKGCGAEFIPNGRGDYLELGRLRFGTCRCCLPKKILIQRPGSESLICAHSGKEHIRLPGDNKGFHLIEDLPFGLCQCCRPRRPLLRKGDAVRCSRSDEVHRHEEGRWVLAPSQPVFDAAAIDELLDAGLCDICATGVSRGR